MTRHAAPSPGAFLRCLAASQPLRQRPLPRFEPCWPALSRASPVQSRAIASLSPSCAPAITATATATRPSHVSPALSSIARVRSARWNTPGARPAWSNTPGARPALLNTPGASPALSIAPGVRRALSTTPPSSPVLSNPPRPSPALPNTPPAQPSLSVSVSVAALAAWSRHASTRSHRALRRTSTGNRRDKSSLTDRPKATPPQGTPQAAPLPSQSSTSAQSTPEVTNEGIQAKHDDSTKHDNTTHDNTNHDGHTKHHANTNHTEPHTLLDRLPHVPHLYRPTKAELLAAASGFWSRMKVRFKWLTIRSNRNFNADELYALFSWVLAAHVAWVILGTTTFFMLTVFLINTAFSQETLAKWIGNYLTKSSGIKVVFETAVVPKWKDGVISFRKVFVSRRPGQGRGKVSKGSQTSAAAEAAIALAEKDGPVEDVVEEDTNYTQFDVSMDTVNVTLSFSKWFNGKGLLKDVEIKGIRGVIDRTSVHTIEGIDPRSYKHEHNPGDFELDSFKMEDLLVTIYQPDGFRPFPVSIYSCELPQLRKQWLFYDFLSANMMSGSFDGSLFTVHPRQTHNYTGTQLSNGRDTDDGATWKKHSRIRIDALNIDHLNRGYEGPFSWIHEGNVDIVADIMLPNDDSESLAKVMSDMYDRVEATVSQNGRAVKHHFSDHAAHGFEHHDDDADHQHDADADEDRFIIMDLRVHLNDVRAAVPIFTRDISYVNNALVRPIVAYINSKRTFIPVNCRVVKQLRDFDGSWTLYDSGLMEEVSREMYDAFARDVLDDRTVRKRRIKKVGIWTLQLAAQALFLGLAGNMA